MRVLVLSSTFPNAKLPNLGVFVRERMRHVARECEVRVVAPVPWFPLNGLVRRQWTGIPAVERTAGLVVHHPRFVCVPRYGKWLDGLLYAASLLPFLVRLRRQFAFDVIDAHFAYPDGLAAVLLGRTLQRPVVITLRGSIARLRSYPLHRPQIRFALRAASRVLAVSASLKDIAVGLGIPDQKIRVVPNGVDTAMFFPGDRAEARRALGLPVDRTILLSVGGLNEGKGHHHVVDALAALLPDHPDLLYVIVGGERPGDTLRPRLEQAIARRGVETRVWIVGERAHAEIPRWLAAADVFCLATRSEGWANVLLEALACGRPVVTTRVGGNAEIVSSDALGILVPWGDEAALVRGIHTALGRAWDLDAMVRYARAHSWEAAARTVVEELSHLVPGAPRGSEAVEVAPGRPIERAG